MLGILDGTVLPADEVRIPATDEGLLRGDGVFEVVRLYEGRPFAIDDHLARMERSAANLRLPLDVAAVRGDIEALIEAGRPGDAVLRVLVTRGGHRVGFIEPMPVLPETLALQTVVYSPTRVLDGVKSLSYGANMLATRLAERDGCDEALLVTPHGRVLEAPTSSFVCSLDGRTLVTPPLDDHILDSITRRRLMQALDAREESLPLDDLDAAEEAFLASTTREVQAVCAIDGRELAGAPGPRTREAAEAFDRVVAAELAGA
jgi:branched-chain amino acid aminotransferase